MVKESDANETFSALESRAGRESLGVGLEPLHGADDPSRPLLNKLLAVPSLRMKYLGYMRNIADKWLNWDNIGPLTAQYQSLIEADVKSDTRKLTSSEAFTTTGLKSFIEQRRKFLLNHSAIKQVK